METAAVQSEIRVAGVVWIEQDSLLRFGERWFAETQGAGLVRNTSGIADYMQEAGAEVRELCDGCC